MLDLQIAERIVEALSAPLPQGLESQRFNTFLAAYEDALWRADRDINSRITVRGEWVGGGGYSLRGGGGHSLAKVPKRPCGLEGNHVVASLGVWCHSRVWEYPNEQFREAILLQGHTSMERCGPTSDGRGRVYTW